MKNVLILLAFFIAACSAKIDIPTGFPTPPPLPAAEPLAKLELKPDAELSRKFEVIATDAKGKVGVAAVVLETGESAMLNANDDFPMQSVYKLPIAMAVMDQVRLGKLELDEKIGVTKDDFVRQGMRSPLRDENPDGGEFTIRELIKFALVESDGTASDVLMRVAGNPGEIQAYLAQIGIYDIKVVNSEKEIGRDWETQYENWSTPAASVELLRWLDANVRTGSGSDRVLPVESEPATGFPLLVKFMAGSTPGAKRLKGLLPEGTIVAHKTGTSGTQNGITAATNDIGIIYLPNGKHAAIAVFVSDSTADEKTREGIIARVAKAAWDKWSK